MQMDRGLQSPTDAIGTTRLEDMSESETSPPQETPTQDANESACTTEEVARNVNTHAPDPKDPFRLCRT